MSEVSEYLKRVAKRSGFKREFFVEKNIPTEPTNVLAVPFYGDMRSTFVLSSLILNNYKRVFPDKYIILCSWPGFHSMFPYVDEFWCLEDDSTTKTLALEANNFYNSSNLFTEISRSLLEAFDVMSPKDVRQFYDNGFTAKYWETFKEIGRYMPEVPASRIAPDLERVFGRKIVIYPATKMRSWQGGKTVYLPIMKDFWNALTERLITEGFQPVVYQSSFTYDMSVDFADKCMYIVPQNVGDVLSAFRYVGCVLDIHTGISRMAIAARCPYLSVTERRSFVEDKDYELDDLCCNGLPHQYIFAFSTQLMVGGPAEWDVSVLDNIMVKLKEFMPLINVQSLPSTSESNVIVSYDAVRQTKAKRMGVRFINSSKDK